MEIRYNKLCEEIINRAVIIGTQLRNEFITPEHVMMAFLENEEFCEILTECGGDIDLLKTELSFTNVSAIVFLSVSSACFTLVSIVLDLIS